MTRNERHVKRQAEHQALKERLLIKNGIALYHPKAGKLWDIAYEHGHSAGEHEIENWIIVLKELLEW